MLIRNNTHGVEVCDGKCTEIVKTNNYLLRANRSIIKGYVGKMVDMAWSDGFWDKMKNGIIIYREKMMKSKGQIRNHSSCHTPAVLS
jgi:hypothetical protein